MATNPSLNTNKNEFLFTTTLQALLSELSSPTNLILTFICIYLIYKIFFQSSETANTGPVKQYPAPLPKHDMTLDELRQYDGKNPEGRICIAVNRKIFDVSKGDRFYGPGKPYAPLAGKDATRALGNFEVNNVKDEWDLYNDISKDAWTTIQEWEQQFSERYEFVGNLVKVEIEKEEDSFEKIDENAKEDNQNEL